MQLLGKSSLPIVVQVSDGFFAHRLPVWTMSLNGGPSEATGHFDEAARAKWGHRPVRWGTSTETWASESPLSLSPPLPYSKCAVFLFRASRNTCAHTVSLLLCKAIRSIVLNLRPLQSNQKSSSSRRPSPWLSFFIFTWAGLLFENRFLLPGGGLRCI